MSGARSRRTGATVWGDRALAPCPPADLVGWARIMSNLASMQGLMAQKCDASVHSGKLDRQSKRLRGRAGAKGAARRGLAEMRAVEDLA